MHSWTLPHLSLRRRIETQTQRRSHVETEAEMGGKWLPAQGWTPGASRSWKRQEGPSPGDSAGSPALSHLDSDVWSQGRGRTDVCGFKSHALWPFVTGSEVSVSQSCPSVCDPLYCSPPGSSAHGILQASILEWVAIAFSRGSSQPGD